VIHYQYRRDRSRRTLRGIDEQVAKAERAVEGNAPVRRNRYIQLSGATKQIASTGSWGPRPGRWPAGRYTQSDHIAAESSEASGGGAEILGQGTTASFRIRVRLLSQVV
jgi:hypothetical protein